ncbi:TRAP transporter small permease subunit [Bauldia sp.]|uniref:TRAP transporter small permease subunit n=1 Tax=Bauldia sp. TaxID=2575872 RepID=UPI003BA930D8
MGVFLAISRAIDGVTVVIGRAVMWLILIAVLVSAGNATIRKAFDFSSNAFLELQWYLYGGAFMLGAAYTLQRNEHVRIDVLSATFSKRTRDWIDLVCHILFLVPFAFLMVYLSWPFFLRSYLSGEGSPNAGGLILWPAKFVVLAGFVLLSAQAISEIIKRAAVLAGRIDETTPPHELPPMIEEMADPHDDEIPGHEDGPR